MDHALKTVLENYFRELFVEGLFIRKSRMPIN